jgi:hypothetical protein
VQGEQDAEKQQTKLRSVMIEMKTECDRVYSQDHLAMYVKLCKNPQPSDLVHWAPVSLPNIMEKTAKVLQEFKQGSDIIPRIASGLSRIAFGLFGSIGLHFTRHHFHTIWAARMMPNVFGVSRGSAFCVVLSVLMRQINIAHRIIYIILLHVHVGDISNIR